MNPARTGSAILNAASPMSSTILSVGVFEKSGPSRHGPRVEQGQQRNGGRARMPPQAIIRMT
jgi:hypothetical protein